MLIQSQNDFAQRFVRVAAQEDTTLAEIFLAMVGDQLFSDTPEDWLSSLTNLSDVYAALSTLSKRYWDSSITRHAPNRTLLTIRTVIETTGLSEPKAALVSFLFARVGVGGFDKLFDYRRHVKTGAATVPDTRTLLATTLAGRFFTQEFAPQINAAISNAQQIVTQGSPERAGRVFRFGDTTLDDVLAEFDNAFRTISDRANDGATEDCNYTVDYYLTDIKRAVACYRFRPERTDETQKLVDDVLEEIKYIANISNVLWDVLELPDQIRTMASLPFATGVIKQVCSMFKTIGQERMSLYKVTSGRDYMSLHHPLSVIQSDKGAFLAPSVKIGSKPLAIVVTKTRRHYGYEIRPNQFQSGLLFTYAQKEAQELNQLADWASQLFASAPPTRGIAASALSKAWINRLKSIPQAVLLDLLIDQKTSEFVALDGSSLEYKVAGSWNVIAQVTRNPAFLSVGKIGSTKSLLQAAFVAMIKSPVSDMDSAFSTCVGTAITDSAVREVDAAWVDSVLSGKDAESASLLFAVEQVRGITSQVYSPVVATSGASQKWTASKTDRPVPELWRMVGLTKQRLTILRDLQQRERVNRLSDYLTTLVTTKASGTVEGGLLSYVQNLTLRARSIFGTYAKILMQNEGASFAEDRHNDPYLRSLNECYSRTALALMATAVSSADPVLGDIMTQLVAWGVNFAAKSGIYVFDVGVVPTDGGEEW